MFVKGIKPYIITGILFVWFLGTLFHFVYEWSGKNTIIGLFTPVNESIWEHTKLLFFPMSLYSLYPYKDSAIKKNCLGSASVLGSLIGIILIITLFYTYSGIIGFNIAIIDIAIFYISVITSFYVSYKLSLNCKTAMHTTFLRILQLIMICLFILFTFFPPEIALFVSP